MSVVCTANASLFNGAGHTCTLFFNFTLAIQRMRPWFLLFLSPSLADVSLTWDTSLGTSATYQITDTEDVILSWSSGHNVYSVETSSCPSSLGDFNNLSPTARTTNGGSHPGGGQTSVTLNSFAVGTYCVACTSHYTSMRFLLTVTNPKKKFFFSRYYNI